MLNHYLTRWNLISDGNLMRTHSSLILPVRQGEALAMLKIAHAEEEIRGSALLAYWNGAGAATVLDRDGPALLLERATGVLSLSRMAKYGSDDEACVILCRVIKQLHEPKVTQPPQLVSLANWFQALLSAESLENNILSQAASVAAGLLASPQDIVILHGDIHHGNVLDFGKRGWLVIDPKGLIGERGFDYTNIFSNPDYETAAAPGALERRLSIISDAADLNKTRLTQWIVSQSALSAVWDIDDNLGQISEFAASRLAITAEALRLLSS